MWGWLATWRRIVLWPGPFTPRTRVDGQGVVTVSAVPRPARFEMTDATRARYLEAVAARAGALGAAGRRLQADVGDWPELARAAEMLQLDLGTLTPEAVDDAAGADKAGDAARSERRPSERIAAVNAMRLVENRAGLYWRF